MGVRVEGFYSNRMVVVMLMGELPKGGRVG